MFAITSPKLQATHFFTKPKPEILKLATECC